MDKTFFTIGFDDYTMRLLTEAAAACHCSPRDLIRSIVYDVLMEDAIEHHPQQSSFLIH